jgi:hypothetical protein
VRVGKYAVSRIAARPEERRASRQRSLASFQTIHAYVTTGKCSSTSVSYLTLASGEWPGEGHTSSKVRGHRRNGQWGGVSEACRC